MIQVVILSASLDISQIFYHGLIQVDIVPDTVISILHRLVDSQFWPLSWMDNYGPLDVSTVVRPTKRKNYQPSDKLGAHGPTQQAPLHSSDQHSKNMAQKSQNF